jgi:short-subunit dehydrogenase/MoaA/NifB/PqqE/SkfB family radical SAM enzyme
MRKYSFKGMHILLTGAGGGLGTALSQKLAGMGALLVLSDRSLENIAELKSTLSQDCTIIPVQADLSVPGMVENLASKAIEALGYIDIVINNAGIGYHALMTEAVENRVKKIFQINVFSPITLVKALLPEMQRKGSGMIINILSCAGFIPTPTTGIYGASKAAFSTMARTLRLEVAPTGVRVYNFYPGPIATAFNENAMRENKRSGVYACGISGNQPEVVAEKILTAAAGTPGDIWLDHGSKWLALTGTIWPKWSDRRLAPLRDAAVAPQTGQKSYQDRRWRLWQIETSIACNLNCIICPWKNERPEKFKAGDMSDDIWAALRPYLEQTSSVDFTGGGEPLLHPRLAEWIEEACGAGCQTGFLTNGLILNREKSRQFIQAGLDWIGFSVDGATAGTYEQIRKGADFQKLCENINAVADLRNGNKPLIMINFVMMPQNVHQVEDIVRLSAKLGIDRINFKQCDVVRGDNGRDYGLFASKETRQIRRFKKDLGKARRLADKLKVDTTAFSFVPDELPVCAQDPRDSLFIRHDGWVAPCINLAVGGPTTFLDEEVNMPAVYYGRLPENDLLELWKTTTCRYYRERFAKRVQAHDAVIGSSDFEPCLIKLKETLNAAREAMPKAPDGCRVCHYLYGI